MVAALHQVLLQLHGVLQLRRADEAGCSRGLSRVAARLAAVGHVGVVEGQQLQLGVEVCQLVLSQQMQQMQGGDVGLVGRGGQQACIVEVVGPQLGVVALEGGDVLVQHSQQHAQLVRVAGDGQLALDGGGVGVEGRIEVELGELNLCRAATDSSTQSSGAQRSCW